ncbi:hypothetical protein, partial [Aestuariivivens sediminicola]|uniref:hypothetical protein n=1 Tax=Aestuariivivens sediminicola TaxID=2913560 RepID=UPI001F5923C3
MNKSYLCKLLYTYSALLLCSSLWANSIFINREIASTEKNNTPYYGILSDYAQLIEPHNSTIYTFSNNNLLAAPSCQNITVFLDNTGNASITPADIDPLNVGPNYTLDISSFDCSDIGSPITVTVTDSSDSSTCTASVTLTDNIDPTITCAADVAVNVDPGECFATVALVNPATSDNCGINA